MVTVNYIRTLNIDEPLARIEADGTILYYHADALGSIITLTDDLGTIRTQYNYSPFGETEVIGQLSDNPFLYTGRENDGTGLYYYRFRYYSPKLKRFISEDPIGLLGGDLNYYVYVWNSPLRWIDPWGLCENKPQNTKATFNVFLNLPPFSEAFPESKYVAPIADLVAAGILAGFSVSMGVAAAVTTVAGPESWIIAAPAWVGAVVTGKAAYSRFKAALNRLEESQYARKKE